MGVIFDISRFCLQDGPGIRTTVFLKGCPLRCAWCHNPESQRQQPEILFDSQRCAGCGKCGAVCKNHKIEKKHIFSRRDCTGCGACAEACPTGALRLAGKNVSAGEIMEEVLRDREYYEESGGGLTVSGGEPMLQPEFLEEILLLAKQQGIHTCIETCGWASRRDFLRILPLVDCFLFDWKESDPEKHLRFTGVENGRIRENLEFLSSMGASMILRLPLIPGCNDTESHIDGVASLANGCEKIQGIEIMPYHPLGISKAKELDREKDQVRSRIPDRLLLDDFACKLRSKVKIPVKISV